MAPPQDHSTMEVSVQIKVETGTIEGTLSLPAEASGVVLFAHGSGSSRHSPRNRSVAQHLMREGLGTLLFDLLTPIEERSDEVSGSLRFNIAFLAERLLLVTNWLANNAQTQAMRIGYFGASTGAAAALVAAAERPSIDAVVSRGGRPDLAREALDRVQAAVLLIVGSRDEQVLQLNQQALSQLHFARHKELAIVPGAGHLFEERGTLEQVARLAADWFTRELTGTASAQVNVGRS